MPSDDVVEKENELKSKVEDLVSRLEQRYEQLERVRETLGIHKVDWLRFMEGGDLLLEDQVFLKARLEESEKVRAIVVEDLKRSTEENYELHLLVKELEQKLKSGIEEDDERPY